ncbi:hypothetical protein Kole_1263 [Kosmotoga olearia TBF 19.5.1]|uniref:Uncharacterized protein n=1 Tax=Kosmotoga olearia (strain ATCC BAA-1733 / DSM 21960 / TBF 19.5.1) TaxID=521045 RepID=C5CD97_KOSOT|nr:hypothetical protein Kole_1263 [Kosmotoga olearia TBF 19.5.1]
MFTRLGAARRTRTACGCLELVIRIRESESPRTEIAAARQTRIPSGLERTHSELSRTPTELTRTAAQLTLLKIRATVSENGDSPLRYSPHFLKILMYLEAWHF